MSKIEIKFDNNIKQDEIIVQLTNSSPTEAGNNYKNNQQEIQQTSIYGILEHKREKLSKKMQYIYIKKKTRKHTRLFYTYIYFI